MATASVCTVACKLPQGLTIAHKGKTLTLNGANASGNRFGFGMTKGVDAEWFNDWTKTDGKDFPAVKNGSIFAMDGDNVEKAKDAATERRADAEVQTGLEPIDPNKPGKDIVPTEDTQKTLSEQPEKDVK